MHVRSQLHSRGEYPGSSESAQSPGKASQRRGRLCCASRNKVGKLMETSASCGTWYLVGAQSVFIKCVSQAEKAPGVIFLSMYVNNRLSEAAQRTTATTSSHRRYLPSAPCVPGSCPDALHCLV